MFFVVFPFRYIPKTTNERGMKNNSRSQLARRNGSAVCCFFRERFNFENAYRLDDVIFLRGPLWMVGVSWVDSRKTSVGWFVGCKLRVQVIFPKPALDDFVPSTNNICVVFYLFLLILNFVFCGAIACISQLNGIAPVHHFGCELKRWGLPRWNNLCTKVSNEWFAIHLIVLNI